MSAIFFELEFIRLYIAITLNNIVLQLFLILSISLHIKQTFLNNVLEWTFYKK